jgi:hypothetical protein
VLAASRASAQPQSRKGTIVTMRPRKSSSARVPAGAEVTACGTPEAIGSVNAAPNQVAHAVVWPSGMVASARFCSTTHRP